MERGFIAIAGSPSFRVLQHEYLSAQLGAERMSLRSARDLHEQQRHAWEDSRNITQHSYHPPQGDSTARHT
jgi:hypothetical protein